MSHALALLAREAPASVGRPLVAAELDAFDRYLAMLQQWQRSQRLIGSTEPGWIIRNLFLDSLMFLRLLPDTVRSMADLGSGAGFPGIPIKIVRPEISVALIESRGRRASFLAAVVRALGLVEVRVLNARAEQVAAESPGSFGAVVMRCAGAPHDVMPLAARLVSPGGVVIASGPPTTRPLPLGVWHEVVGLHGQVRRFAIYRA